MNDTQEQEQPKRKGINCDQVSWVMSSLQRYAEAARKDTNCPSISRLDKVARIAALLEIMEVLGLKFEDDMASGNAIAGLTEFNELRQVGDFSNKV